MTTLPKGWSETEPRSNRPGTYRYEVRSAQRFRVGTLRTVTLEGVAGVKLIAGKLRPGDRELARHGADSMVPQAIVFAKPNWPQFRNALEWQISHFTRLENPPRGRGKYKILTTPEQHQLRIAKETLKLSDAGARILGGMTKGEARAIIRKFLGTGALSFFDHSVPREDPPLDNPPGDELNARQRDAARDALARYFGIGLIDSLTDQERGVLSVDLVALADEEQLDYERAAHLLKQRIGGHKNLASYVAVLLAGRRRKNPPRRLEDFKRGASDAIAAVVKLDTAISALFVKALEMDAGGEGIPEKLRHRIRTLQLEKKAALENVKRAIARHGAAIGEFHVPRSRRANPSDRGGRAAAVRLYEEFHGVAPKGFTTKHVPDLSQLVHLGRALRVDYEAARPRGPRGTPYRHAFDAGSELFTDRTGRALVILGNIKVSRAPRGRFGYIRAGAGED